MGDSPASWRNRKRVQRMRQTSFLCLFLHSNQFCLALSLPACDLQLGKGVPLVAFASLCARVTSRAVAVARQATRSANRRSCTVECPLNLPNNLKLIGAFQYFARNSM